MLLQRQLSRRNVSFDDYINAAIEGDAETVRDFLRDNIHDIDRPSNNEARRTALIEATMSNHLHIIQELIGAGADVNKVDGHQGATALYYAAARNFVDACTLLINNSARINTVTDLGVTPLYVAARLGRLETCQLLINKNALMKPAGACVDFNPIIIAADNGHLEVLKYLSTVENINVTNTSGMNVLHHAARREHFDVCEFLVDETNININASDNNQKTALDYALMRRNYPILKLLLQKKAKSNILDDGVTYLHLAAEIGDLDLCKIFIADVNAVDKNYGFTPLHVAAAKGNVEMCELLISYGAQIDSKDSQGRTALHLAAQYGYDRLCKLLLKKNADPYVKDGYDKLTPLHLAAMNDRTGIIKIFHEHSVNLEVVNYYGRSPLHQSAESGKFDVCKLLVLLKANVHALDKYGNTALHLAAKSLKSNICKLLINSGLSINANNNYNQTPMHLAVLGSCPCCKSKPSDHNYKKIVKLLNKLLKRGGQIDQLDNQGNTLLHYAAMSGYLKVCKFLLDIGLNAKQVNKQGKTAADACEYQEIKDFLSTYNSNNTEVLNQNFKGMILSSPLLSIRDVESNDEVKNVSSRNIP